MYNYNCYLKGISFQEQIIILNISRIHLENILHLFSERNDST